jgi:hypothetical protein
MKPLDEITILSESAEAYIGICTCCSTINFIYKNVAIKFKEEEFLYFKKYMEELNPSEFLFESKTGKNIFMSTPVNNIVFCFKKEEVEEINLLMQEAFTMLQVYKVLK